MKTNYFYCLKFTAIKKRSSFGKIVNTHGRELIDICNYYNIVIGNGPIAGGG